MRTGTSTTSTPCRALALSALFGTVLATTTACDDPLVPAEDDVAYLQLQFQAAQPAQMAPVDLEVRIAYQTTGGVDRPLYDTRIGVSEEQLDVTLDVLLEDCLGDPEKIGETDECTVDLEVALIDPSDLVLDRTAVGPLVLASGRSTTAGPIILDRTAAFADDFEDGTLDEWTIAGRQAAGTNVAEVVTKGGSTKAHLFHSGFTEITLEREVPFRPGFTVSFEMETSVSSSASGTSDFYASAGVTFTFLDAAGALVGRVGYWHTTSSFMFNPSSGHCAAAADLTNESCELVRLADGGPAGYSFTMEELLNLIVPEGSIERLIVRFNTYGSGHIFNLSAHLWLDDFRYGPE